MKIVTFNVNGLRAALSKGLADWVQVNQPDVLCLQEVKISHDIADSFRDTFAGYHWQVHCAEKKGYSGVAILSKEKPKEVIIGSGNAEVDKEGRILMALIGDVLVMSVYLPSGTMGDSRQVVKDAFMEFFLPFCQPLLKKHKKVVICGDFNICHTEIDIHNPKGLSNTSGFLPHERAWMTRFIESGFVDSLRVVNEKPAQYTWWSFRANARAKNLGWRLDYQFVSEALHSCVKQHVLHTEVMMSDHIPTTLTLQCD